MKKYQAEADWRVKIEVVECERESDSCIWIGGRRVKKDGPYRKYFNTFEEAKQFCIKECEEKVGIARRRLNDASSMLGNAKGLKQPQLD